MKILFPIITIFLVSLIPVSYAINISNQQIVGDNSSEQGILLEFTDNTLQPQLTKTIVTPNLEFAWIESNSGTIVLDSAKTIVTEKGTIRISSQDPPLILFAHPLGNGNYKINFYSINNGILDKTMYNAELIENTELQQSAELVEDSEGQLTVATSEIVEKKNLIVDVSTTDRSEYYDNFLININVWDADINPNALLYVSNDGRLADVPVKVILTKPDGDNLVTMEGKTDIFGVFEGEYRWLYGDLLGSYNVDLDVDNGNFVRTFSTFYDGFIQDGGVNAPRANAGADQNVVHPVNVVLDGSASSGTGTLTFSWTQIAGPAVVLNNANTVAPDFNTVGAGDTYTIRLTVTDDTGKSSSDTVTITT